jgi:hypothetical protein
MTKPILSLQHLAWTIGVPLPRLKAVAEGLRARPSSQYGFFALKTGPDKVRHIRPPRADLMEIQRRIVQNVLLPLGFTDSAHGSIRGRSARTNAEQHLGKPCVVKIDVASFFDNVKHRRVYRMFREDYGFGRDVASLMARLVTLDGSLPQGAPTSPSIANLFVREVDDELCRRKSDADKYTRYVDDLTVSGPDPRPLIGVAARLLAQRGLPLKKSKLVVAGRDRRQEVTGCVVNRSGGPTIPRQYRDGVRAAIHQLQHEPTKEVEKRARSIRGRIAHIAQFQPGAAARLRRLLDQAIRGDKHLEASAR